MGNDEWYTPLDLTRKLNEAVDGFDLDAAAGCEPFPIAPTRYTKEDDGTQQPWFGKTFVNPPYSRHVIDAFAEKAHREAQRPSGPDLIVMIIRSATNADWWHDHVVPAEYVCMLSERPHFGGANNDSGFPTAIVAYGDIPRDLVDLFHDLGHIYEPRDRVGLEDASVDTELEIQVDTDSIAHPCGVDAEARAIVLAAQEKDGILELLAVAPDTGRGHEVYYLVEVPTAGAIEPRVAVARGIRDAGFRRVDAVDVDVVAEPVHYRDPRMVVA